MIPLLPARSVLVASKGVTIMTTISEMLARNARSFPNDIALVERMPSKQLRRQITWRQFDERVNRIANALIARGIRKGDKVIHWMMNSTNWPYI